MNAVLSCDRVPYVRDKVPYERQQPNRREFLGDAAVAASAAGASFYAADAQASPGPSDTINIISNLNPA